MGKKPVLGLFGLVWVGIALTGCGESCRNCRNKFNAPPTFPTRTTKNDAATPVMIGDAKAPSGSTSTGASSSDTPGGPGFATKSAIEPVSATSKDSSNTTSSIAPPISKPTTQNSLRPLDEPKAPEIPATSASGKRLDDGLPAMTTSRPAASSDNRQMAIPPRPMPSVPSASAPSSPPPAPSASSSPTVPPGTPLPAMGSSSSVPPPPPPPTGSMSSSEGSALPPLPSSMPPPSK